MYKKLSNAELEVMIIIWDAKEPVNAEYILEQLKDTRNWKKQTLHTVLSRIANNGFLSCEKNYKNHLFSPLITEEEYKKGLSKTVIDKIFENSLPTFVTYYYDKGIAQEELTKLYDAINKAKENSNA